jgi:hypothetical protein
MFSGECEALQLVGAGSAQFVCYGHDFVAIAQRSPECRHPDEPQESFRELTFAKSRSIVLG